MVEAMNYALAFVASTKRPVALWPGSTMDRISRNLLKTLLSVPNSRFHAATEPLYPFHFFDNNLKVHSFSTSMNNLQSVLMNNNRLAILDGLQSKTNDVFGLLCKDF
jgi:hypothetical protein